MGRGKKKLLPFSKKNRAAKYLTVSEVEKLLKRAAGGEREVPALLKACKLRRSAEHDNADEAQGILANMQMAWNLLAKTEALPRPTLPCHATTPQVAPGPHTAGFLPQILLLLRCPRPSKLVFDREHPGQSALEYSIHHSKG
jgi:hypothetical protein